MSATLRPMVNERLRGALIQRDVSIEDVARKCKCDPKTAGRWITKGRVPHRSNRQVICELLGLGEDYLWPEVKANDAYLGSAERPEIVTTYPDRASVPREVWLDLLTSAIDRIDVLVFSGTFLAQTNPRIASMLADRAAAGVQVRLCFGEPAGSAIELRDKEEGIGGTLGAKARASLSYFTELRSVENCAIRLHDTTLYASLFRYDDQLMVNPHILGRPSSANPLLQVRDTDGDGMFKKYMSGFEEAWKGAETWQP